jgi:hypothetical protein
VNVFMQTCTHLLHTHAHTRMNICTHIQAHIYAHKLTLSHTHTHANSRSRPSSTRSTLHTFYRVLLWHSRLGMVCVYVCVSVCMHAAVAKQAGKGMCECVYVRVCVCVCDDRESYVCVRVCV